MIKFSDAGLKLLTDSGAKRLLFEPALIDGIISLSAGAECGRGRRGHSDSRPLTGRSRSRILSHVPMF